VAFERLQALGDEQFKKILNLLMRGEPAMHVARTLQQQPPKGWGIFQDVAEKTLTAQLNRLREVAAEGAFGLKAARRIAEGHTPQIKRLEHVSISVLVRMEELADIQRTRVLNLVEKEKDSLLPKIGNLHLPSNMPSSAKMAPQEYRHLLTQTNLVFNDYRQLLLDLQKIRFDLGLDEFKGPVSTTTARGATQTTTFPDGMSVQKQIFEAVTTIEQIFDARKIPRLIGD